MNTVTPKNDPEVLSPAMRWMELAVVGCLLLLFAFFADHQWSQTGFLTAQFGNAAMLALYAPILLAMPAPIMRAWTGRRNPARPLEGLADLALALGSLWLLITFPFNFAHLGDVMPGVVRFVIGWLTNDWGRMIMIAQVVISFIGMVLVTWKYLSMRGRVASAA